METRKIIIVGMMVVMGSGVFYAVNSLGSSSAPTVDLTPQIQIQEVEYVPVLVIDADVTRGQRITESMLTSKKWPAEALTSNLVNIDDQPGAKEEFVNSLARQAMAQGEPISRDKVIKAGDSGIMAALLKPGMRAVTTRISVDTAAGGFIQPGDRVDIIMRETFKIRRDTTQTGRETSSLERDSRYVAQTLFENVKVLAIDQTFTTTAESGAAIPGSTATFELSQSDSELLQEAEGFGDLYLTLRGVSGSGYKGRSSAVLARGGEEAPTPRTLTIYRNGEPTPVALQNRN